MEDITFYDLGKFILKLKFIVTFMCPVCMPECLGNNLDRESVCELNSNDWIIKQSNVLVIQLQLYN